MRPFLLFDIAASALLSGCGGDSVQPAVTAEEKKLGAEQHPLLLAEFGGAYDGPESDYVIRLGEKVAAAAGLEGLCRFTLVNSDVVNAFAVPGCYIYVTRGLAAIVNSEAELVSVLAHEVGHIVGAHSRRQQQRSLLRSLGVAAVALATGSERLTQIAGAAAQMFTLRYSRTQEYEADTLGIAYVAKAGYDPFEAADMLGALGRQERFLQRTRGHDEARGIPEWARTHPLTENRIARARDVAQAQGVADDELPEAADAYLREIDALLYGDDPAQGFVQGRRFAHPGMRIAFEAPTGFTLTNSPQTILIEGPDGIRGEFAGGRMPAGGLEAYAAGLLEPLLQGAPARVGRGERSRIGGIDVLSVPVAIDSIQGRVSLVLAAFDSGDGSAYHFLMAGPGTAPVSSLVADLVGSFRRLTPEQARQLQPRFIRTIEVKPGQQASALAALMAADHPLDHFLMLNDRTAAQPLRPGERVKIIVLGR